MNTMNHTDNKNHIQRAGTKGLSIGSLIIITAVVGVILLIFSFGTLDYDLSVALINKHSLFGEFFNMFGEMPANLAMAAGVFILYAGRKPKKIWSNIIMHVVALPLLFVFLTMSLLMPVRYVYEFDPAGIPTVAMGLVFVVALLLCAVLVWWANCKAETEHVRTFKRVAIFFIVVVFAEILLVNVVKILWGRPRMRSMESIEQFHHWWKVAGPAAGEEFKSFPSGHTANGFAMILWSLLISKGTKRNYFVAFALLWGSCVALSRVILGAHFITDVAVGGYITLLLFYLLKPLFVQEELAQ